MRSTVWLLLASVVAVGVFLLLVLPTRTLIDQHHQIAAVRHQLSVVDAESSQLRQEVASLHQPATIERIASQEFGLVKKGQKAYAVLPSGSASASGSASGSASASASGSTGRSSVGSHPAGRAQQVTRRSGPVVRKAGAHRAWWRALELWRDL